MGDAPVGSLEWFGRHWNWNYDIHGAWDLDGAYCYTNGHILVIDRRAKPPENRPIPDRLRKAMAKWKREPLGTLAVKTLAKWAGPAPRETYEEGTYDCGIAFGRVVDRHYFHYVAQLAARDKVVSVSTLAEGAIVFAPVEGKAWGAAVMRCTLASVTGPELDVDEPPAAEASP